MCLFYYTPGVICKSDPSSATRRLQNCGRHFVFTMKEHLAIIASNCSGVSSLQCKCRIDPTTISQLSRQRTKGLISSVCGVTSQPAICTPVLLLCGKRRRACTSNDSHLALSLSFFEISSNFIPFLFPFFPKPHKTNCKCHFVWLINFPRRQDAWDAVGTASVCVKLVFVSELRGPLLH